MIACQILSEFTEIDYSHHPNVKPKEDRHVSPLVSVHADSMHTPHSLRGIEQADIIG